MSLPEALVICCVTVCVTLVVLALIGYFLDDDF